MSMKKKFLALALAGMVAMPVVASASNNTQSINIDATQNQTADVTITGSVDNNQGQAPAGRIQVELPTAMSFTVDQDGGDIIAANNYQIRNTGQEPVKVEVINFTEQNPSGGIEIVDSTKKNSISSQARHKVYLGLSNGSKEVDLSTLKGGNRAETLFGGIQKNSSGTLRLVGVAGATSSSTADTNGLSEDFTLTFRVSKGV